MLDSVIPWLGSEDPFPPIEMALRNPNGLLAAGRDLSPETLLDAYAKGIFPWSSDDEPLLWWSPDPRMVIWLDELHVSRSLRRRIRSGIFSVTADMVFRDVMIGCARDRRDAEGTWITEEMIEAYTELHRLGYAHSVEAWRGQTLAGGVYGVAIGHMFFGESMFAQETDASKVALAHLVRQLTRWGFELIDCQMSTAHLTSLGAREIPRAQFLERTRALVAQPPVPAPWHIDAEVAESFLR